MNIPDISNLIYFIHFGTQENIYFSWKSKYSPKAFIFDYTIAKDAIKSEIYFHLNKADVKIVYQKKNNFIYIIGGHISVQFQILEALLDHLSKRFMEIYGDVLFFIFDIGTDDFFKDFISKIEDTIKKIPNQVGTIIRAYCRICGKYVNVYVKKSMIEDAEDYPVALVYMHHGHSLLLYIDADFKVRGAEIVSITG